MNKELNSQLLARFAAGLIPCDPSWMLGRLKRAAIIKYAVYLIFLSALAIMFWTIVLCMVMIIGMILKGHIDDRYGYALNMLGNTGILLIPFSWILALLIRLSKTVRVHDKFYRLRDSLVSEVESSGTKVEMWTDLCRLDSVLNALALKTILAKQEGDEEKSKEHLDRFKQVYELGKAFDLCATAWDPYFDEARLEIGRQDYVI